MASISLSRIRIAITKRKGIRTREAIEGYLYLSPWIMGLVLFYGGPMIASLALSFTEYDVVSSARFVGLLNYKEALLVDSLFWSSLGRTFYYALATVPIGMIFSLLLAVLLNQELRGTYLFRTFFFLPTLTPAVAAAFIWKWVLNPQVGLVNWMLWKVGIEGPGWMTEPRWVIPSLIIVGLWGSVGGTRMLIFLAALQGVPQELYEAAEIDGGNHWHKFWNITLPMVSPAFLFNLILGIINALRVFTIAYTATDGGPGRASWFYGLHVWKNAFQFFYMGYASALAWLFLIVIFVLSYINFSFSDRWVYYEGGVR